MRIPRALRRAVPLVPDRAWPVLLAVRSAISGGPLVCDPDVRNVVVLAAHPDDESLGCGGTIALLTQRGARVSVHYATDGETTIGSPMSVAETARRRRQEAITACGLLGVEDIRFWGLPDGGLPAQIDAVAAHIRAAVTDQQPDGIFLPWFLDGHADHEALATALAAADVGDVELWGYETWAALPANRLVDVTRVWDRKEAAIDAHATAALAFDLRAGLGMNRWRSLHGLAGKGYAEAFLVGRTADWLALRAKVMG